MNHITDQFYGVTKGKEKTFVNGFHQIFHSINNTKKGIYCSDNLLTWGRNLSFMKNERLMKIFNKFSKGQYPLHGILWRMATIVWAAEIGLKLDGDFVECGCYKGTTAKVVHEYLEFSKIKNKRYFLYDLFEYDESFSHHAMPEHSKTLCDEVKDLFKSEKNVVITKGKLPETLSINCPEKISFMHLDLNNVDAEIGTLEILFEKMVPGSIIVLDDFGWMYYEQQNISELNWFNKKGYSVLEIPTGQGILIKR